MADMHPDFELLNQQNLRVLRAYAVRHESSKASDTEYEGWLCRLDRVDDVDDDQLVQTHGQLIAMGLLKFELSGRSVGLRYQISNKGWSAMQSAVSISDDMDRSNTVDAVESDLVNDAA